MEKPKVERPEHVRPPHVIHDGARHETVRYDRWVPRDHFVPVHWHHPRHYWYWYRTGALLLFLPIGSGTRW